MKRRAEHYLRRLGDSPSCVIFGHADADGFLATEQTRRNLTAMGVRVRTIVVSAETGSHRFWHGAFANFKHSDYELVVTVDIAFSFREPEKSFNSLLSAARANRQTHFVAIDHHPMLRPQRRLANLDVVSVSSAYDCCLGEPSDELMLVAALCEGERSKYRDRITERHTKRAIGVRRAAAD